MPAKDRPLKQDYQAAFGRFCLCAHSMAVVLEIKVLGGCSRSPSHASIAGIPRSHDRNFSNCPMQIRMPGEVAGARSIIVIPYADFPDFQLF
jgi:hypothetical protein